ncbi:MAG: GDSL-type esterase/lipase family protein [Candidatus Pristimantibacillus lignocellulolyticus]|uniref:GDSL-type esterase/lipase family protein n=1 Tax=Candidatus Pristimantibacillus lignocellulolyticus TaxID=2994561 RepID=A0A9J6ZF99_9BACL|nr:MAG: GDSL-type esterase/lipase family protein [Candidatus Pristimantibacillus lignocellulolyticus]
MAEDRNIVIEDASGNRYYPHTKAENVAGSNGQSVAAQLTDISEELGRKTSIDVSKFGAVGVGDETINIQTAINAAISTGIGAVFFPQGSYNASSLVNINNVNLLGDRAELTVGGENYKLIPINKASKSPILYGRAVAEISTIPQDSLKRAIAAVRSGTLRIAYWGDSITEGGGLITLDDGYPALLARAIRKALPNVALISQNMSLGGRTSSQAISPSFVGQAADEVYPPPANSFKRPWSTVGKSWINSVRDFKPDLLVIAFGMNDAASGSKSDETIASNLSSILGAVNTWNPVPSCVFVPTVLPTKDHNRYNQTQNATKAVARATREVGHANKVIVADANRLFQILRDGVEDVSRASNIESNWEGYSSSKWEGDKSHFNLSGGTLTPTSADTNKFVTRKRSFYNGVIQFDFKAVLTSDYAWIDYRKDSTLGSMTLFIQPSFGIIGLYSSTDGGTPSASVTGLTMNLSTFHKIRLEVFGARHLVFLNNVKIIDVLINKKFNDGYISFGSNQSSVIYANLSLIYEDSLESEAPYTEDELLGVEGINHPSAIAHGLTFFPTFNGVLQTLSAAEKKYDNDYTSVKTGIPAGASVDLFSITFSSGQWKSILVEITASGMMAGVAARIVTNRYHLAWSNTSGVWTQLDTFASGAQLSLSVIGGANPKLTAVTGGTAAGSDLKVNMHIIGDPLDFIVTAL